MTKPNKISREFAQEVFDLVKSQEYTSLYQLDAKLLDEITYWHPSIMIEISEYLSRRK
ncbi:hypothetical protein VPIG_00149 [Vibrio phage PWH3a-P1]|uniref:hypothetical protein n=1 Tax=Vibrio phage PWH3a-P1 TaxID=754058 RepID=UPI0002C0AD16|nr:hypothetical protein VPIG_00149 [Vibrio phage PWH3a-P1]AGH32006.1 hypothetical protein VPIG_00149 [Vibrio phage PWH3a-P1]